MMAMLKHLDAGSFFLCPLLSFFIFLALVLKVCRNRFSCHGQIVSEPAPSKLSNLSHSVKFMARHKKAGGLGEFGSQTAMVLKKLAWCKWLCLWPAGANVPIGRQVVKTIGGNGQFPTSTHWGAHTTLHAAKLGRL
jgi:hypothetical protein